MEYIQEANMDVSCIDSIEQLEKAYHEGTILCSRALIYDKNTGLHFNLGGYKAADEAIEYLAGNDRVWYDTSSALWYLTPERAGEIIRALNPEKVMFGTDYPVKNPAGELERFFAIPGLTDREREDILWNNAVRFLHLEVRAKELGL